MKVFHKESDKSLEVVGFAYAARDGVEAVVVDENGEFNSIPLRHISQNDKKTRKENEKKATEKAMKEQEEALATKAASGKGGMTESEREELIAKGEVQLSAEEQAKREADLKANMPHSGVTPGVSEAAKEAAKESAPEETHESEESEAKTSKKSRR